MKGVRWRSDHPEKRNSEREIQGMFKEVQNHLTDRKIEVEMALSFTLAVGSVMHQDELHRQCIVL